MVLKVNKRRGSLWSYSQWAPAQYTVHSLEEEMTLSKQFTLTAITNNIKFVITDKLQLCLLLDSISGYLQATMLRQLQITMNSEFHLQSVRVSIIINSFLNSVHAAMKTWMETLLIFATMFGKYIFPDGAQS